jgi:hypothetical protein
VNAKDVKITSLVYNTACLDVVNLGDVKTISVGNTDKLRIKITKRRDYCAPNNYKITVKIQGYNTREYSYDIYVPVSAIKAPYIGTVLTALTKFDIWDVNANSCGIFFNNFSYSRVCNSSFVYNNYCKQPGICIVNVSSDNNYFTYYSADYVYSIPNIASKGLASSYSPKTLYLQEGEKKRVYVTLDNLGNTSLSCSFSVDTNLLTVLELKYNSNTVPVPSFNFNIDPHSTSIFEITFQGVKPGVENAKVHIVCSGNRRIDIILPTVVYKQAKAGVIKTETTDEKISSLLLAGVIGVLLLI